MQLTKDRVALIAERRAVEESLAEIKAKKQEKELAVLERRLAPRDEFSALKQISIHSRQEGQSLRARLAEITAELGALRDSGDHPMADAVALLTEIRDLLKYGTSL